MTNIYNFLFVCFLFCGIKINIKTILNKNVNVMFVGHTLKKK